MHDLIRLQKWFRGILAAKKLETSKKALIEWYYAPEGPGGRRDRLAFSHFTADL